MRGIARYHALGLIFFCAIAVAAPTDAFAKWSCASVFYQDQGPKLRYEPTSLKQNPTATEISKLKLGHYSLDGFELFPAGDPRNEIRSASVGAILRNITFEKPDVLSLSEVMNRETLNELAIRLGGTYQPIWVDGNDPRSLALLIRKSTPLLVEVESHRGRKHKYFGRSAPVFTHDFLLMHLILAGSRRTLISIGATHFKSRKTNFPLDPNFNVKRAEQEAAALSIMSESRAARNPYGQIIMGDMNVDVRRPDEMSAIKAGGFRDVLQIANVPMEARSSHSHFPNFGDPIFWQTDAIFVSPELNMKNGLLSGYIAQDRAVGNEALGRPRSAFEVRRRGSDHQMIVAEIDVIQLLEHRQ